MSSSNKTSRRKKNSGIFRKAKQQNRLGMANRYGVMPDRTGDYGIWDYLSKQWDCVGLEELDAKTTCENKNKEWKQETEGYVPK